MSSENWSQIKDLLQKVLPLDAAERENFLRRAEIDDEIRFEVESLLAFEESADNLLNHTAIEIAGDFLEEEAAKPFIGREIGVYKIVREIGAGGMGVVFLAERTGGEFEQQVAIKFLRQNFFSKTTLNRFLLERHILATLNHPFIARLIDGGQTADGTPYLVMEYVEGEPITKYADEKNLSLRERLVLFMRVCQAVAYAHRNSIIHRDLKPDNILITSENKPKLLDFGIAKLLSADDVKATVTQQQAFTPEYASPEQLEGKAVTTVTDVYILGIILHELLTGKNPFAARNKSENNSRGNSEIIRPSLTANKKAARKNSSLISSGELRGDLDNIVLKSLRAEPESRYQSVERFAEDIGKYLDGLPVSARPATFRYRAGKFVRRNKAAVFAAAFIIFSLFAATGISLWQVEKARQQAVIALQARQIAEDETKIAEAEKEKAEKISRFMAKFISYANPAWYAEGSKMKGEAKVIDALEEMGEKIETEFPGQPDVQAELHHKFTEVYNFIDESRLKDAGKKQLYHARRALELRKQFYGERHELVAKDLFYLWAASREDTRNTAKILAQAIRMMRETNPNNLNFPYMLTSYASNLVSDDAELNEIYQSEIPPQTGEGNFQTAERYYTEALEMLRNHYKKDNYAVYVAECELTLIQARQKKFTELEPHYKICRKLNAEPDFSSETTKIILRKVEKILAENDK